jgi:hypothetical protein
MVLARVTAQLYFALLYNTILDEVLRIALIVVVHDELSVGTAGVEDDGVVVMRLALARILLAGLAGRPVELVPLVDDVGVTKQHSHQHHVPHGIAT